MRGNKRGSATLVLSALLISIAASAVPGANTPAASSHELAVWVPLQLTFTYRPLTTQYSCSGLEQRVKKLLLELGARADLEVRGYGCTKLTGPDPLAGVKIRMSVLEPAGSRPGLAAHWQRVDLLGDRETFEAAADCEPSNRPRRKSCRSLPCAMSTTTPAVSRKASRPKQCD